MEKRVFIAANEIEAFAATSLNVLGQRIGVTGNVLRAALCRSSGDPIQRNGYTVYVSELERIKGRGKIGQ